MHDKLYGRMNIIKAASSPQWLLAIVGIIVIMSLPSQAAGLKGSKHDLSGESDSRSAVCVFCHAPNTPSTVSDSGELTTALWNSSLSTDTSFKIYNSLGLSSTKSQMEQGSVSMACLSCHDGSQASDVSLSTAGLSALAGSEPTTSRGDNRSIHPFGIPYKGLEILLDPEFNPPSKLMINGSPVWWVDTGRNRNLTVGGSPTASKLGQREKTDIQLYSQFLSTFEEEEPVETPYVECASCHNPHTSETNTFLRFDNNGSELCLSCHIK